MVTSGDEGTILIVVIKPRAQPIYQFADIYQPISGQADILYWQLFADKYQQIKAVLKQSLENNAID